MIEPFQKIAAHAFIKRGGKYLVTRRARINDYKPSFWDLPGGTIKVGETAEEALEREIKEETNLKVKIVKPIFVCSAFDDGKRHQFWIVYECKYLKGEVELNSDEHDEYRWANKLEMEKLHKIYFLNKFYNALGKK